MNIRPTPMGFLAVSSTGEEIALRPTAFVREQAIIRLKYGALTGKLDDPDETAAADMLARCELRYEPLDTDAVGVVIVAPADLVEALRDHDRLPVQMLMTAIYEGCPDLRGDRVESAR